MTGYGKLVVALTLIAAVLSPRLAEADNANVRSRLEPVVSELIPAIQTAGGVAAVTRFMSLGEAEELGLEGVFTSTLLEILREKGVTVRDPDALAQIMDEGALMTFAGGGGAPPELGEAVGATVLVTGQLSVLDELLSFDLKVLDVASGEVRAAGRGRMVLAAARGAARARTPEATRSGDSVEISLRRLADELAASLASVLPDDLRYVRAAVVDFQESGEGARKRELGKVVAAEMATLLRRDHYVLLVERGRLKEVFDEHSLSLSGVVDPSSAVEMGALLGADLLIFGEVSELGDQYRINVRAVSTKDASVVSAVQGSLPAAGLIALSSDAVVLRSRSGAVFRSVLIPGWGQFYNRQAIKGTALLSVEALTIGAAATFHLLGGRAEQDYLNYRPDAANGDSNPSETAEVLRLQAEQHYRVRNILAIAAAGVWLYNLADAFAYGRPASADWAGTGIAVLPTIEMPGLALTGVW